MLNTFRKILKPVLRKLLVGDSYYHYLTKTIVGESGLKFAANAIASEYFRTSIKPTKLVLAPDDRLLIIAPHQDDEVIGCGGLMLKAKQENIAVRIVFFTDGVQDISGMSESQVIQTRNNEAIEVAERLGAEYDLLEVSNKTLVVDVEKFDKLTQIIAEFSPTKIASPWLLDYPIKHRYVNHVLAVNLCGLIDTYPGLEMIGYQVHNNIVANQFLDISNIIDEKIELVKIYQSQIKNFKHFDRLTLHMAGWNARFIPKSQVENQAFEYVELYAVLKLSEFTLFVRKYYEADLNENYCGDLTLINQASKFKKITQ
jgi:LmbE family N-acetylglucosaminyl deacetylase